MAAITNDKFREIFGAEPAGRQLLSIGEVFEVDDVKVFLVNHAVMVGQTAEAFVQLREQVSESGKVTDVEDIGLGAFISPETVPGTVEGVVHTERAIVGISITGKPTGKYDAEGAVRELMKIVSA